MDTGRVGRGEMIAGISAVALFIFMFFSWFAIKGVGFGGVSVGIGQIPGASSTEVGRNAWQSFSIIDLILLITIIAAVSTAVASATARTVALPVATSSIVCGLGILSVLLVLFRIISTPDFGAPSGVNVDVARKIGVFLGLIAAGGIAAGGWMAMQEEGTSFSSAADQARDRLGGGGGGGGAAPPRGGGGTPPPPPPAGGPPSTPPPAQ